MALDQTIVELVVTFVAQETHDDVTYPVTQVHRFEFESPEAAKRAIDNIADSEGMINYDFLTAGLQPPWKSDT